MYTQTLTNKQYTYTVLPLKHSYHGRFLMKTADYFFSGDRRRPRCPCCLLLASALVRQSYTYLQQVQYVRIFIYLFTCMYIH